MKTKCVVSVLTVLFMVGFVGCNDDDKEKGIKSLPGAAQTFIEVYLPGYSVLGIEIVDDKGDEMNEKYRVTLSNDMLVSFSSMGFWRKIKSGSELPEFIFDVLPSDGPAAVKMKYPGTTINEINFTEYGCQVVTSDGISLAFYSIFSGNKFGLDLTDSPLLWPTASRNLLAANYAEQMRNNSYYFFQESEEDGSGYRFGNVNSRVSFDKDGEWYCVDGRRFSVPSEISAILPERSKTILGEEYGLGTSQIIAELLRDEAHFLVRLLNAHDQSQSSSVWYMFHFQTGMEVEPPKQAVLDFLNDYAGLTSIQFKPVVVSRDTKQGVFYFENRKNSQMGVDIYTDANGRILYFAYAGRIRDTVLSYLPVKVKEYAEANYAGKAIFCIVNGLNGEYYVQYDGGVGARIYYNKDGNIVHR